MGTAIDPMDQATAPSPARPPAPSIVLVDDEALFRSAVARLLRAAGYQVLAAPGPEQALAMVAEAPQPISLLITDVNMPRMDGFELSQRATALQPQLRTLFVCGYPPDALADLPPGAHFLEKPFAQEEFLSCIRQLLGA